MFLTLLAGRTTGRDGVFSKDDRGAYDVGEEVVGPKSDWSAIQFVVCETYDEPEDNIVEVVSFATSAVIPYLPLVLAGTFLTLFSDATSLDAVSGWNFEGVLVVAEGLLGVGVG